MTNTRDSYISKLKLYQSANKDAASIKSNFVIRLEEYQMILDTLKRKKAKDSFQHELIMGRRGSGKSTLLKRIEIEIKEDKVLSQKYLAINFAEEQAGIYRLSDLWYETYMEMCRQLGLYDKLNKFSEFENENSYTRYVFKELSKIIKEYKVFPVLLIDNFDKILSNLDDKGNLFREQLLNYDNVKIIAASTRMDEYFWSYDVPFFDYFRIHRLGALSLDEFKALLNHWAEVMNLPKLKSYADHNKGKIEAIRILTDGLPRTLQFFIRILVDDSLEYGFDYINQIMDLVTPIYQERLNNLTPPQRKILSEMAFIWESCSTKMLVDKCRMESKLISAHLKKLTSFGLVDKIETGTKNHLYKISERFFNMWYIVTQGNPAQKKKAQYLTIFLENWYDGEEISKMADKHLEDLSSGRFSFDKAIVRTKALSQSKYLSMQARDELLDETMVLAEPQDSSYSLPEKSRVIIEKAKLAIGQKRFDYAIELINSIENKKDGLKFYYLGWIESERENYDEAIKNYAVAASRGVEQADFNLAKLYSSLGNFEEAENFYNHAIAKGNVNAMFNLANQYYKLGRFEEAEVVYDMAIQKGHAGAMNNLGHLWIGQGKLDQAEEVILLAINTGLGQKEKLEGLVNLGNLYSYKGDTALSEKYYYEAIDIANDESAIANLLVMYIAHNLKHKIDDKRLAGFKTIDSFKVKYLLVIYEILNAKFSEVEKNISHVVSFAKEEKLDVFLFYLLALDQKHLVLNLFESKEHGPRLKDQYRLLYYATLILTGKGDRNLELRIPSEVKGTVSEIVGKVKEMNLFYSS